MKAVSSVIKVVGLIAKYAGIVLVIVETVEFLQNRLKEKFPDQANDAKK